jgi:hypothetical protein
MLILFSVLRGHQTAAALIRPKCPLYLALQIFTLLVLL